MLDFKMLMKFKLNLTSFDLHRQSLSLYTAHQNVNKTINLSHPFLVISTKQINIACNFTLSVTVEDDRYSIATAYGFFYRFEEYKTIKV